jgi:hypothetical protein
MSLRIELRTRTGKVLGVTGEVYDALDAMLPELNFEDFPLAAGIDRYSRTMFNSSQMAPLTMEFERMLSDAPERRRELLNALIEFCNEGSLLSECELWFLGD